MVKNSSKIIVTTSWDDAHPANFNLVELLNKYNLKGTFYLDKNNHSIGQIKTISSTHEIGSHSLTHADLTKLDLAFARKEIIESKKWLERTTGQPIKMFAYPFGFYNEEIKKLIRQAGFVGARTTKEFCFEKPNDFFEWGTTLHIYPFPLRKRDKNYLHLSRFLFQPFGQKLFKILK